MEGKIDNPKKQLGAFYLDRNQAFYFEEGVSIPLQLDFPPDIVSDLEIIHKNKFEALVQAFIDVHKIIPKNLLIVLSREITFEKDFVDESIVSVDKEMKNFLDFVPFENVLSKTYKLSKKTKVVAVNKTVCDTLRQTFESQNFSVMYIIPAAMIQEVVIETSKSIDLHLILKKIDALKQYNLLDAKELVNMPMAKNKKPVSLRMVVLLGILCLLVIIFLALFYTK